MTDEVAPPPSPATTPVSLISLGFACSVATVLVLADSYYGMFVWLPKVLDVYHSVKVHVDVTTELMGRFGRAIWALVALCAVLSFVVNFRQPGRARSAVIAVVTFLSALILTFLVRHSLMASLVGLLQGIGTSK